MSATILRHRATAAVAGSLFFWVITAGAVAAAHRFLEPHSPVACLALSFLAIITMAFAYMRLVAREATIDQALFVGLGWVTLAILVEVIDVSRFSTTYPLFGSPSHEVFRDLLVIAWLAAPVLFVRRRS